LTCCKDNSALVLTKTAWKAGIQRMSSDEYSDIYYRHCRVLCQESVQQLSVGGTSEDCCRRLLLTLLSSEHPTAFIVLRQALVSKFSWLVAMIDSEDDCGATRGKIHGQYEEMLSGIRSQMKETCYSENRMKTSRILVYSRTSLF